MITESESINRERKDCTMKIEQNMLIYNKKQVTHLIKPQKIFCLIAKITFFFAFIDFRRLHGIPVPSIVSEEKKNLPRSTDPTVGSRRKL
jgi:hypothetical protein